MTAQEGGKHSCQFSFVVAKIGRNIPKMVLGGMECPLKLFMPNSSRNGGVLFYILYIMYVLYIVSYIMSSLFNMLL